MIDELICRAFHGRVTAEERAVLQSWRKASRSNERHYADLWRLLSDTRMAVSPVVAATPPAIDLDAPAQPVETTIASVHRRAPSRTRLLRLGVGLAAGIAILLGIRSLDLPGSDQDMILGTGEIVTGASEMTTVKLGDGTIVRLAPSSRLHLAGAAGTREVWLEGHAYFAVAKHPRLPFRVRTHAGDAVVLGTRFDLKAREDHLRLLVVEGAVSVAAGGRSLEVGARESASTTQERGLVSATVDDSQVREELRWLGDFLVFEETPLAQVARELTVHFNVPVEVLDEALAEQTVRGMFVEESLDSVVQQLCQALSAHCSITASRVTMSP